MDEQELKFCASRCGPKRNNSYFSYLQVVFFLWMCLVPRVEAIASGLWPFPETDHHNFMVCLDAMTVYVQEECLTGNFSEIDDARAYFVSMMSTALDCDITRTELADELVSRICLKFDLKYYPTLITAMLLSKIPVCVCGDAMLPLVHRWARVLIRCGLVSVCIMLKK